MIRDWILQMKEKWGTNQHHSPQENNHNEKHHINKKPKNQSRFIDKEIKGRVTYIYAEMNEEKQTDTRPAIEDDNRLSQERRSLKDLDTDWPQSHFDQDGRESLHDDPFSNQGLEQSIGQSFDDHAHRSDHRYDQKSTKPKQRFQGNLKESQPTPSPIAGYSSASSKINTDHKFDKQFKAQEELTEKDIAEQSSITLQERHALLGQQTNPETLETEDDQPENTHKQANQMPDQTSHFTATESHIHTEPFNAAENQSNRSEDKERMKIPEPQNLSETVTLSNQEQDQAYAYPFPALELLKQEEGGPHHDQEWVQEQANQLLSTFSHFNLKADLIDVTQGPTVTRFEVQPAPGMKISKFTNLQDDLKLALAAKEIRIEAPIPGKHAIGIEVPNHQSHPVLLGDILRSDAFQQAQSPLTIGMGAGLEGDPVVTDIQRMPHGLIAGSTGSGKSVCINSILVSLLYRATPEQLRLLLIDPKMVELTPYQQVPHLVTPVVTDPKKATASLKWAVEEMERRYQLFAQTGVRDLGRYNQIMEKETGRPFTLPYIVIVIDELADLMMVSPSDVEDAICRITQKARACGIHLIVATQRPSVDVITGLIKSNIPTRIAFAVSSQVDSRTILDSIGAERLLGKGDMLFLENGSSKPTRVQGNFVTDEEIQSVVQHVSEFDEQQYMFTPEELQQSMSESETEDELIEEAAFLVMEQGTASTSSLQRKFRIGYNRAARMIDWMEEQGMITEAQGSKPRNVIWSQDQFLDWLDQRS